MKKCYYFKLLFLLIIINILLFTPNVSAGRGCCSHNGGVNESKCTTDGRQVCKYRDKISNGESCKCDPNNYSEENLVDPEGHDETNPYSYWDSSNDYEDSNNYSNQYNDIETVDEEDEYNEDEIVDETIKEGYLALSCTALIGTLIAYLTRIPPKKEHDY